MLSYMYNSPLCPSPLHFTETKLVCGQFVEKNGFRESRTGSCSVCPDTLAMPLVAEGLGQPAAQCIACDAEVVVTLTRVGCVHGERGPFLEISRCRYHPRSAPEHDISR